MNFIYLDSEGNSVGPVDKDAVIQEIRAGRLTAESPIRNALLKDFRTIGAMDCFAEALASAGTAEPTAAAAVPAGSSWFRFLLDLGNQRLEEKRDANALVKARNAVDASVVRRGLAMFTDMVILCILAVVIYLPTVRSIPEWGEADQAEQQLQDQARKELLRKTWRAELRFRRRAEQNSRGGKVRTVPEISGIGELENTFSPFELLIKQDQYAAYLASRQAEKAGDEAEIHQVAMENMPFGAYFTRNFAGISQRMNEKIRNTVAVSEPESDPFAGNGKAGKPLKHGMPRNFNNVSLKSGQDTPVAQTGAQKSEEELEQASSKARFQRLMGSVRQKTSAVKGFYSMGVQKVTPKGIRSGVSELRTKVPVYKFGPGTGLITGYDRNGEYVRLRFGQTVRRIPLGEFQNRLYAPVKWIGLMILLYYVLAFSVFAQSVGMWFWGIFLTRKQEDAEVLPVRALVYTGFMLLFGVLMIPSVLISRRSVADWICGVRQVNVCSHVKDE